MIFGDLAAQKLPMLTTALLKLLTLPALESLHSDLLDERNCSLNLQADSEVDSKTRKPLQRGRNDRWNLGRVARLAMKVSQSDELASLHRVQVKRLVSRPAGGSHAIFS